LTVEAGAESIVTLRTNVSVPRAVGSRSYVQRQRWFTVVDSDAAIISRARAFSDILASILERLAELTVVRRRKSCPLCAIVSASWSGFKALQK
jgi:hypothetical protein